MELVGKTSGEHTKQSIDNEEEVSALGQWRSGYGNGTTTIERDRTNEHAPKQGEINVQRSFTAV